jgi:hypothetical protein
MVIWPDQIPSPTPSSPEPSPSSPGLSTGDKGTIAGAVFGGVGIITGILGAVYWRELHEIFSAWSSYFRRRNRDSIELPTRS